MGTRGRVLSKCYCHILEKQILPIVQTRQLTLSKPVLVRQGRQLASTAPVLQGRQLAVSKAAGQGRQLASSISVTQERQLRVPTAKDNSSPTNYKPRILRPRRYIPRRAVLYVPGNDEKKIEKLQSLNVDCAVLDCEDGVAANRKAEARSNIAKVLSKMDFDKTNIVVRVNSVDSGLIEEDLKVIFGAKVRPYTLMLPKVDTDDQINTFFEMYREVTKERPLGMKLRLITFVESAMGLMNLKTILLKAFNLGKRERLFSVEGVVFGADDYYADIGATKTPDAKELTYARQRIVSIAKAYKLQVIDMVHTDYKDLDALKIQAEAGAALGYTGKQVIHPGQIDIVQQAFTPSPEKVRWATELIEAFNKHQEKGKGAFTFHGTMIDMPLVLQAQSILQMAEAIE